MSAANAVAAVAAEDSKVQALVDAVASIPEGASLSFSGFGHGGHPMAFVRELIRQGRGGFTLDAIAECWPAEFLTAAGRVEAINLSNLMFEGLGRCRAISRAVESGEVVVDDHSHLALSLRLMAAGWGMPFLPVRSLGGTDIEAISTADAPKYARTVSPFDGVETGVVSPLRPDVAIIHVNRADVRGNGVIDGAISVVDAQVRAAKRVIVTTERIVPSDEIVDRNQLVTVPGVLVDSVVHTPYGSHPAAMYGEYDEDLAHMAEYYEASRSAEAVARYLEEWVTGPADHAAYLDRVGARTLFDLRVDPTLKIAYTAEEAEA